MSPEEFQKRLDAMFMHNGVAYGRVGLILEEEENHHTAVLQYQGYLSLSAAFKCVFREAVELLNTECWPNITKPLSEFYGLFLAQLTNSFHSLFGVEGAANRGYPLLAYTSLRNVLDDVVLSSAAMQNCPFISGHGGLTIFTNACVLGLFLTHNDLIRYMPPHIESNSYHLTGP